MPLTMQTAASPSAAVSTVISTPSVGQDTSYWLDDKYRAWLVEFVTQQQQQQHAAGSAAPATPAGSIALDTTVLTTALTISDLPTSVKGAASSTVIVTAGSCDSQDDISSEAPAPGCWSAILVLFKRHKAIPVPDDTFIFPTFTIKASPTSLPAPEHSPVAEPQPKKLRMGCLPLKPFTLRKATATTTKPCSAAATATTFTSTATTSSRIPTGLRALWASIKPKCTSAAPAPLALASAPAPEPPLESWSSAVSSQSSDSDTFFSVPPSPCLSRRTSQEEADGLEHFHSFTEQDTQALLAALEGYTGSSSSACC